MDDEETTYLIHKAKQAQANDPSAAKAWILATKTLYPNNFAVQFEAYTIEKNALNSEEAAKCLSYIIHTFQNPPEQLWLEIAQLTAALKATPADPSVVATPQPTAAITNSIQPATSPIAHHTTAIVSESVDFYVRMFQHIPFDVQQKILQLTAAHSGDNNSCTNLLEHARLIMLLLRRFPRALQTHAPRLLETLVQGLAAAPNTAAAQPFREILINEVMPLVQIKTADPLPDVPAAIVNRVIACAFEYHVQQMFRDATATTATIATTVPAPEALLQTATVDAESAHDEHWRRLLDTLAVCGQMLQWEPFPRFERGASKDSYWKAVCQIVAVAPLRPSENKQILFCATILFVMSLQTYMKQVRPAIAPEANHQKTASTAAPKNHHTNTSTKAVAFDFVLVEGFRDLQTLSTHPMAIETTGAAQIAATSPPCSAETAVCLVTAANCWQLLHSNEMLQMDFSQLLRTVPLSEWISAFLVDLAFYVGSADEAQAVLADANISKLERSVRVLSLVAAQPNPSVPVLYECILKTFNDATETPRGDWITMLTSTAPATGRHMILLPLSRRAIVQYCTKIIVRELRNKFHSITDAASVRCSDSLLGNLLVLLQLDWPTEYVLVEHVFAIIAARGAFTYTLFPEYIICVDFIEQFMAMWYPHGGDVQLTLASPTHTIGSSPTGNAMAARRIGTRGADKGVRDDFKQLIRHQITKCGEPLDACVERFLIAEQNQLMQNLYEK